MRAFLSLLCLGFVIPPFAQPGSRHIELERNRLLSEVSIVTNDTADKALKIAAFLLNSKAFQDSVSKLSFPFANHCDGCDKNNVLTAETITGRTILDSIFRSNNVALTLRVKKVGKLPIFGKCFGLGNTCPNRDSITSFYKNIQCDMGKDLPFSYAYAVHLCHEYSHNVGYCHTDNDVKNDIAEAIGWIAFYFINKWYHDGTINL